MGFQNFIIGVVLFDKYRSKLKWQNEKSMLEVRCEYVIHTRLELKVINLLVNKPSGS